MDIELYRSIIAMNRNKRKYSHIASMRNKEGLCPVSPWNKTKRVLTRQAPAPILRPEPNLTSSSSTHITSSNSQSLTHKTPPMPPHRPLRITCLTSKSLPNSTRRLGPIYLHQQQRTHASTHPPDVSEHPSPDTASHDSHFDPPSGWLFGVPPGEKYKEEGWEKTWVYGFWGSLLFGVVAYAYKPDTS